MRKRFVLDTSVILHDADCIDQFGDNDVYIPLEAITEVDKFKTGQADRNINSRRFSRRIKSLIGNGIPEEGISLEGGGRLFFLSKDKRGEVGLEERLGDNYADTIMLERALELRDSDEKDGITTYLVTNDNNFLIRAKILGLEAEDYKYDKVAFDLRDFFKNKVKYRVGKKVIDGVHRSKGAGFIAPEELRDNLTENQYVVLRNGSQSCLARYKGGKLFTLSPSVDKVGEIKPKNAEQKFLLDACLNPEITIVSAIGKAGTGKTLMAIAAALDQVMYDDRRKYEKITIFRPIMGVGGDLGFLPGDVDSKIGPYFRAIDTAISVALGDEKGQTQLASELRRTGKVGKGISPEDLTSRIEKMPITYSRGDTFHHTFMIIDEAQNLKASEIKMLGTRMGYGSKMVLTGDPFQIDNPYLDERSNGLTTVTYRLKGVPQFSYVVLDKGERSTEAGIFADKM